MTEDTGQADPRWTDAVARGDMQAAVGLLLEIRVLVPVVAMPGEQGHEAEMAVPALVNEAGRRALPVFTSVDALSQWRSDARPVPMPGAQVLAAAVEEGYDGLVVDVASDRPLTLDRTAIAALAGTE